MKELTEKYIANFNTKNFNDTLDMFHEDAVLTDPINIFKGKQEISQEIERIFDSCETLSFKANNIFYDNEKQVSIIEFVIALDLTILTGTDVIEWKDGKIKQLRAYLNLPDV